MDLLELLIFGSGGAPAITVTGAAFGSTPVGTPKSVVYTIKNADAEDNPGTATLEITLPITMVGAEASAFTVTVQPAVTSLAPGASTTFTVQADADSVDVFSAVISIESNASGGPTLIAITVDVDVDFLVRYDPATTETAPKASPIVAEPEGSMTLVQLDGQYSSDGKTLDNTINASAAWTDVGFWAGPFTRAAGLLGLTMFRQTTLGDLISGWRATSGIGFVNVDYWYSSFLRFSGVGILIGRTLLNTQYYMLWSIIRSNELLIGLDDQLHYIKRSDTASPEYFQFSNNSGVAKHRFAEVAQLGGAFASVNDIATVVAAPTSGQEWTGFHDGLIAFTWTPTASQELQLSARYGDDDNRVFFSLTQGTTNNVKLVEREGGVSTTVASAVSRTLDTATAYFIVCRWIDYKFYLWIDDVLAFNDRLAERVYYADTVKINAAAVNVSSLTLRNALITDSAWRNATRIFVAGGDLVQNTVSVPDGANLNTYIAMLYPGDILSLATNGNYTTTAGQDGFLLIPNGTYHNPTIINGNGATVTGGRVGMQLTQNRHLEFNDLIIEDATTQCLNVNDCSYITFNNCIFRSDANPASFNDTTKLLVSHHLEFNDCTAGPSVGVSTCDGFECYYAVYDSTFNRCTATGLSGADGNGFEVFCETGSGECFNITFNDCIASNNGGYGFSNEGGPDSRVNPNIQVNRATVSNNTDGDYRGTQGSTLYIHDSQAGVEVGSVVQN